MLIMRRDHTLEMLLDLDGYTKEPHDHIHRGKIKPYAYTNAESLLKDFWEAVEVVMKKEGIKL